jgi:hypothetical protein
MVAAQIRLAGSDGASIQRAAAAVAYGWARWAYPRDFTFLLFFLI